MWIALAEYYIRQGMLEKARDIFQEGMEAVATVHDFSLIYETLTQFEEKLIQIKMEKQETNEEVEVDEEVDAETFLLLDNISDLNLRYGPKAKTVLFVRAHYCVRDELAQRQNAFLMYSITFSIQTMIACEVYPLCLE